MTYSFVDKPPRISQILYRPPERVHHKGKQTSWGPATLLFVDFLKYGVIFSDLIKHGRGKVTLGSTLIPTNLSPHKILHRFDEWKSYRKQEVVFPPKA